MARASEKRGGRPRPNARQRGREEQPVAPAKEAPKRRPEYEQDLFFSKLRGRAKWVFAVLAGIFALSFVALGVGTGVSGASLGDVIRDIFGGGDDTPSVADALDDVANNPDSPEALRDLANAYVGAGQRRDAAAALEQYVEVEPDDASALRQLATLYAQLASLEQVRARELLNHGLGQSFASQAYQFPGQSGFFGALGQDPIDEAVTGRFQQAAGEVAQEATRWHARRTTVFEKLAAAVPDDPSILIELAQAATLANQPETAIETYEQYLAENPDGEYAASAQAQLDELRGVGNTVTG